jgi:hypothetical protein
VVTGRPELTSVLRMGLEVTTAEELETTDEEPAAAEDELGGVG